MRTAVITGASSGLGFQAALALARSGAHVVMACRNLEKAERAQKDLVAAVPDASTVVIPLDVSEPESIRAFGRQVADRIGAVDLLINNAGVVGIPLSRNSVGHELQFATNYLSAFALTGTLLPLLREEVPARIVNVGSLSHRFGRLDLDDLNWERTPYNEWKSYARSKLAVLTFTMELCRRLKQRGSGVLALAAHPGFAATEVAKDHKVRNPSSALGRWLMEAITPLIPLPERAALPILLAASSETATGGDYYGPRGLLEIRGVPGRARVNPAAKDVDAGKRLWTVSEAMTGVRYLPEAD